MLGTRVLWSRPRPFRMISFDLPRGVLGGALVAILVSGLAGFLD
jgi:hypothetical protein